MPRIPPVRGGAPPPATAAAGSGGVATAPTQLLSATPVANVNGDVILAGDVFPAVDRVLAERFADIPDNKRDEVRIQLAKQRLTQLIEMQLLYNDAIRAVPKDNLPLIDKQLNQQFQEEELPRMMEIAKVESAQQFDEYLRLHGDSIERAKRRYRHEILARQWLGRQSTKKSEITYDEMLTYYHEHEESYKFPSRARWEQLTVRYSSVADPQEARRKIAWMGNQVIDGAAFAGIAKQYSNGAAAAKGGQRDWTTKGSLVSEELDRALFTLPVGYLSPIIEHAGGLSIVRVTERQNAGKTSFLDAQAGIKEEIRKERHDDSRREYLDKLRKQARIWNLFDDPGAEAMFASRPKLSTQR